MKNNAIKGREKVAVVGVVLAYTMLYIWGAMWVWSFVPDPRPHWWGFPACITTVFLFFLPIFAFAWLDCIFDFSGSGEEET